MKWLVFALSMLSGIVLSAQNDIVFSHYIFNPTYYNPAYIEKASVSHAMLQFRSQWTGYQASFDATGGAPLTQAFSTIVPLNSNFSGFGVIATNDQIGPVNNVIAGIPLAYTMKSRNANYTVGLMPMLYSQVLNFNLLRFVNPQDPLNVGTREVQFKPNMNAGILMSHKSGLSIGVSALNVFEPTFDYGLDSLSSRLARSYSVISAADVTIGRKLTLVPSVHVRTDLNTFSFDLGALVYIQEKAWGGLSYRYGEAITFFAGYSILGDNKLQIGYALDYVIDEQNAKQPTSQEFFIRYNLPNLVIGGRKQVKTPRFAY